MGEPRQASRPCGGSCITCAGPCADRYIEAMLRDPLDGTCRLCGGAPTDARKLCATCIDELTAEKGGKGAV